LRSRRWDAVASVSQRSAVKMQTEPAPRRKTKRCGAIASRRQTRVIRAKVYDKVSTFGGWDRITLLPNRWRKLRCRGKRPDNYRHQHHLNTGEYIAKLLLCLYRTKVASVAADHRQRPQTSTVERYKLGKQVPAFICSIVSRSVQIATGQEVEPRVRMNRVQAVTIALHAEHSWSRRPGMGRAASGWRCDFLSFFT
jgi:hypothetical protein